MARKTGRAALVLSEEHRTILTELAGSRTAAQREVERAKVPLAYAQGNAPTAIQRALGVSRPTIYKCIDKALATGVMTGLRDRYHRARAPEITEAAKAWVVSLACQKPKDLGLAAELWTISALAQYVAAHASTAGFARLSQAGKCSCGMGPALSIASATGGYVMSDRGTWPNFKNRPDLAVLVEGDKRFFNQYGVMLVSAAKHSQVKTTEGQKFVDWVTGQTGQSVITSYKNGGEQLFFPNAAPQSQDRATGRVLTVGARWPQAPEDQRTRGPKGRESAQLQGFLLSQRGAVDVGGCGKTGGEQPG